MEADTLNTLHAEYRLARDAGLALLDALNVPATTRPHKSHAQTIRESSVTDIATWAKGRSENGYGHTENAMINAARKYVRAVRIAEAVAVADLYKIPAWDIHGTAMRDEIYALAALVAL
jgi:hypothetical protein